ncbi:MAG TPA: Fic family protein [Saprospirales bacterium]|jgi:Fic family protein|nr:Fic family protein [Saprospirales bacterium]
MSELSEIIELCNKSGLFKTVDYNKYNDLLMIHSSSVMEGSTLTLHETEMLITENITPEGRPLEHSLMIKDHYKALMEVHQMAKSESLFFTHEMIKNIGALVMHGTGDMVNTALGTYDKSKGDYRLNNVRSTGGHYYINYDKVQAGVNNLITTVNESINKVSTTEDVFTLGAYTHLEFLTVHPFGDGNGRTARLLNNLILLHKGLPLIVIDAAKKGKYIEAIKKSREQNTLNAFSDFLKKEYVTFWKRELNVFKNKTASKDIGLSFSLTF